MRKLLYTTTALVGAAFLMEAAPAKAEVNLAARYNANIQFGDAMKDDPMDRGTRFKDGARVDFSASKDHPNGLTTSFFSRMNMNQGASSFDDITGAIAGAFGTVTMGSTGNAGSNVHVGGTPGTTHFGVGEGNLGAGIGTDATDGIIGRNQSIRYNSMSFSGFKFALSYAPEVNGNMEGDGKDDPDDYNNGFALGLGYSNDFAGTSISLSGSFASTDSNPNDYVVPTTVGGDTGAGSHAVQHVFIGTGNPGDVKATSTVAAPTAGFPDKRKDEGGSAFSFGASVGYQDFTFGGSWGQREQGTSETTAWRVGASYAVDAFTFGVGYGSEETQAGAYIVSGAAASSSGHLTGTSISYDADGGNLTEETSLAFTVDYKLGDGANIDFGIEVDEVTNTNRALAGGAKTKEATYDDTMFGVGVTLSF